MGMRVTGGTPAKVSFKGFAYGPLTVSVGASFLILVSHLNSDTNPTKRELDDMIPATLSSGYEAKDVPKARKTASNTVMKPDTRKASDINPNTLCIMSPS